ncbi:unnamed protein product [Paramecium pentaurelia]|uniref:Uncharacterized protein n=1 Tax=Paramecium pentaurelia TaxID=43138 RepID=A0A8S1WAG0_9CILI|nr:unnamed protein product [Paramecium pentaurelia]
MLNIILLFNIVSNIVGQTCSVNTITCKSIIDINICQQAKDSNNNSICECNSNKCVKSILNKLPCLIYTNEFTCLYRSYGGRWDGANTTNYDTEIMKTNVQDVKIPLMILIVNLLVKYHVNGKMKSVYKLQNVQISSLQKVVEILDLKRNVCLLQMEKYFQLNLEQQLFLILLNVFSKSASIKNMIMSVLLQMEFNVYGELMDIPFVRLILHINFEQKIKDYAYGIKINVKILNVNNTRVLIYVIQNQNNVNGINKK